MWSRVILRSLWFLAPFLVYLRTLTASFLADDSPETISDMVALEHMHPPGYPAFTLLGRVFMLLPVGGPAFRASLLAATAASLACWLASLITERLARRLEYTESAALAGASSAAALLAFSFIFWEQALSAKGGVYTLNTCILAALITIVLEWHWGERKPASVMITTGFLAGIGLAHHWMTLVAVSPALAAGGWPAFKRDGVPRSAVFKAAVFALLGASLYLFLPIRASTPVLLNWGRPDNLKQLVWVVSRAHYAGVELGKREEGYWFARFAHLGKVAMREWTPILFWTGLGGGILLAASLATEFVMIYGAGMLALAGALFFANPPPTMIQITDPYLIPFHLGWAVMGGVGIAWAAGRLRGKRVHEAVFPVLVASVLLLAHGRRMDCSRYYLAYDYGWNLLQGLPKSSVIFCEGDFDLFSLMYHHEADDRRPDTTVMAAVFLDYDWYRETAHKMLPDMIPREHELLQYTVKPVRPLVYTSQHEGGEGVLKPVGLVLRPPLGERYGLEDSAAVWRALRFRGLWDTRERGAKERDLAESYGKQMVRLAQSARDSDLPLAIIAFMKAVRMPIDKTERILARYGMAQLLLQMRPSGNEQRAYLLAAADRQLSAIIASAPAFHRAYVLKGNVAFLNGDRPAAREWLTKALEALPSAGVEAEKARIEGLLRGL
jgi:hypothetical protein